MPLLRTPNRTARESRSGSKDRYETTWYAGDANVQISGEYDLSHTRFVLVFLRGYGAKPHVSTILRTTFRNRNL